MSAQSGPPPAPSDAQAEALRNFRALVTESRPVAQASARTWASGVAVFIGVFSSVLLVSGPETTAGLAVGWRWLLVVLLAVGLGCALVALWSFFTADAGVPQMLSFEQFQERYEGSREVFDVVIATRAADMVGRGRKCLLVSLIALSIASVAWLSASPSPSASTSLTVETRSGATYCGELSMADAEVVALKVNGAAEPVRIPYSEIERMIAMTGGC